MASVNHKHHHGAVGLETHGCAVMSPVDEAPVKSLGDVDAALNQHRTCSHEVAVRH